MPEYFDYGDRVQIDLGCGQIRTGTVTLSRHTLHGETAVRFDDRDDVYNVATHNLCLIEGVMK